MAERFFVETALMLLGIVTFVTLLVGAMVLLTTLRQRRAARFDLRARPMQSTNDEVVTEPAPPVGFAAIRAALRTTQTVAVVPQETDAIPDWMRLPVREAVPDQIVIQIEPDNTVSPQKRSIQRLIAHLEAQKAASDTAQVG
jgi:hypothetical protein